MVESLQATIPPEVPLRNYFLNVSCIQCSEAEESSKQYSLDCNYAKLAWFLDFVPV